VKTRRPTTTELLARIEALEERLGRIESGKAGMGDGRAALGAKGPKVVRCPGCGLPLKKKAGRCAACGRPVKSL